MTISNNGTVIPLRIQKMVLSQNIFPREYTLTMIELFKLYLAHFTNRSQDHQRRVLWNKHFIQIYPRKYCLIVAKLVDEVEQNADMF